ncbi:GNAT family N-acetyltransferase [Eggerthella guodeyinii]|uniref:GNAT family N-acetyltransferase n=1 Tax=Eggerthella guodeyinii TaxID=2690837 RepID=A0A6L7IYS3_9ACTN|nr:GNAT family N-acetyltransferase [Eggerthella guodeyinii]QOS67609.1 GNAT family N-acetyltransferase [Eggerthella guodeyinii]
MENESVNGTFLQSRRFMNYHPKGKFEDCSLVFYKGNSISAVVPACIDRGENEKVFLSHGGSTFGGFVVNKKCLTTSKAIELVELLDSWLVQNGFDKVIMKQTPSLFSKRPVDALDYAFQHEGYEAVGEISYVIDFADYSDPIESNFSASRRRDCRYAEREGLSFRRITTDADVARFYGVLKVSLKKYGAEPVHALAELLDFKNERLCNEVRFYGVYLDERLIAGSMVFAMGSVFHAQYLAADPEFLNLFPMNLLDKSLISLAKKEGFSAFSFGISTENHGRDINLSLAAFKEGFGGIHSTNRTFLKSIQKGEPKRIEGIGGQKGEGR